jgi:hypothetical protein
MFSYQYTKSADLGRLTKEITDDPLITIALDHMDGEGSSITIWFKAELPLADKAELDIVVSNHIPTPLAEPPIAVQSLAETSVTWQEYKDFYAINSKGSYINYIDYPNYYYLWLCFREQKLFVPYLPKGTSDSLDFETNFKAQCNLAQANEVRLRTCRYGRKQHCRFVSVVTASQDNFDNTDYLDVDYGDVTYTMVDASRNVTIVDSEAKETWIDWMPNYSYEVRGGSVYIPTELSGDLNAWEIHVVGAPDIPKEYGGCLNFLANPKIKWNRGAKVECNSELDPAEATYMPGIPANKIRFIFKHPVGAQVEFQIHLNLYIGS